MTTTTETKWSEFVRGLWEDIGKRLLIERKFAKRIRIHRKSIFTNADEWRCDACRRYFSDREQYVVFNTMLFGIGLFARHAFCADRVACAERKTARSSAKTKEAGRKEELMEYVKLAEETE